MRLSDDGGLIRGKQWKVKIYKKAKHETHNGTKLEFVVLSNQVGSLWSFTEAENIAKMLMIENDDIYEAHVITEKVTVKEATKARKIYRRDRDGIPYIIKPTGRRKYK